MTPPSPFALKRVMSLSGNEFAASLAKLGSHEVRSDGHRVFALEGGGSAYIRFTPAPPRTFGGLLALPQAEVVLSFSDDASDAARTSFVRRFDIAFQRGGG